MVFSDIPEVLALTNLMEWDLDVGDFTFMMCLEPGGCFVAILDNKVVGVSTAISFGSVGWIGNVVVEPQYRGRGIGKALVGRAISYLKSIGVTTIGLYAYKHVMGFYEQFGFTANLEFLWLVCPTASWDEIEIPNSRKSSIKAVEELDVLCFGASRLKLLRRIQKAYPNMCRSAFKNGRVVAYVMGSKDKSADIGPWVCLPGFEEEGFAIFRSLGREVRGLEVHVGAPAWRQDVLSFLSEMGFVKKFSVIRMYLGKPLPDTGCLLALESLERG
jgi:GNAT superfamily N-acetyltransferase